MSALFDLWGLISVRGMAFVNFAKSFSSPYTVGLVLFVLVAITLFAGCADRPRAGRIAAAVCHRAGACRIGGARLATAGRGDACRSTGGVGSGGESRLAGPGVMDSSGHFLPEDVVQELAGLSVGSVWNWSRSRSGSVFLGIVAGR
jgi:hypothetical protein